MDKAIIDRLWDDVSDVLYISKEQFVSKLEEWDIRTCEVNSEVDFVFLVKGPAFHFHSFSPNRSITMKMGRPFIQRIIDDNGYATTTTPKDDARMHRFNKAFGFKAIGEDKYDIHYRIDKLRHA